MQSDPSTNLTRGYAVALISAAILSTTAIFIRYLTQTYQIPALVLAFWRDVIVVVVLLPLLAILRPQLLRLEPKHRFFLLVYGFVLAIFNSLWTLSVALNGAAVATVLAYTSAAFTALLGRWFLKERLDWAKILAVVVSLGGCVLVSGAWDPAAWSLNFLGIFSGILAGLAYAVYSLLGRSAAQRGLSPWTSLLYIFAFAAAFLLLFNFLPGGLIPGAASNPSDLLWLGDSLAGWGILFLLAAGPTLAGFGMYNLSLTYLPSSVANLIATTEPPFTALMAYFFLSERLSLVQIGGSAMILGAVIFLRLHEGRLVRRIFPA
jgi:drug/metabolite transporter (DMT)-like permease